MKLVWFTDCRSVVEAFKRETLSKISDKRLGIELASLRQSLQRREKRSEQANVVYDEFPTVDEATDVVRWVDTKVMIADPLTKKMDPDCLIKVLDRNVWDITQPEISKQIKLNKQQQRKSGAKEDIARDEDEQVREEEC
jgi:hypothetical protein